MSTQGGTGIYMHEPCDCDQPDAAPDCAKTCTCKRCTDERKTDDRP